MGLTLTKHHGLGNDFLVVFDDQPLPSRLDALVRRLCDRHRGIGADGLIVGAIHPEADADIGMTLFNADGGRAEMSGNGIRCLAQAWAQRTGRDSGRFRIATDAGVREVVVRSGPDADTILATASMGPVTPIPEPPEWAAVGCDPGRPVVHLGAGNPHAVVAVEDVDAVDLLSIGLAVPDVNVEVVEAGPEPGAVTMRVHERGVGLTEACGTGAVAVAVAAAEWGLAQPSATGEITVHMEGGDAIVRLGEDVLLTGPATFIARIEVP
jgi:diaminopimelate epimerase